MGKEKEALMDWDKRKASKGRLKKKIPINLPSFSGKKEGFTAKGKERERLSFRGKKE